MRQGLPTDLIFIDRKILPGHVQIQFNEYGARTLEEFITHDLASVEGGLGSIIRPFIGKFGSGKTTQIEHVKRLAQKNLQKSVIVSLNLRDTPLQREEFIGAIQRQVIDSLKPFFEHLVPSDPLASVSDSFGSVNIVRQIRKFVSGSHEDKLKAREYFYDEISEEKVFQLLKGVISLATLHKEPVVFLIDELEYLATYDKSLVLSAMVTERLMRQLLESFPENLLIAFTCEQETFLKLKELNKPFFRVAKPQEIVLDALSEDEKREFVEKLLEETMEYTFGRISADDILSQIHGTLAAFFMDQFVNASAKAVLDHIDIHKELLSQIHETYEKFARKKAAEILANQTKSNFIKEKISKPPEREKQ